MRTAIHLNLRVDPTQFIPQIREVPGYDYIHLVRQPKYMTDLSLLNEKVHYLNEIFSPKDFVEKNKISLLHAHHGQLGILLLPFKEATNLPLVTSIRGRDATLDNQPVGYLENMRMLFDQGERFFPVCQYLAERISDWGCPSEKIRVLYGGIDLSRYQYRSPNQENSLNILSVGRLVEKKGHHILMQAFQKIRDKFPNLAERISDWGCPSEKIRGLYGGIDLSRYQYPSPKQENSLNILSVGRLVEKKGHHILMQAFQKIRDKFPNATLTIIGKGDLQEYLTSLANILKLGDSFRLLNHLPKDKVREHMSNADLFCAASLTAAAGDLEGIPNTLKEAMATGVPVISTYHAGIPELITHNQEGILVKENNVAELADALEFMLTNRGMWETYSLAARQKVEQAFDQNKQLLLQAKYYDELLRGW